VKSDWQVLQTEARGIYQGWKVTNLGKFMSLQRGYDLPHRERKIGNVPIITSSGFGETHSEAKVMGPGVVTGRYGTIGDVFYVQENFWPLNTTLYVKDFHGNDPLFAAYLLRTIDFHTHNGKSGVPGVNRNDLYEIRVYVPSTKKEQKLIAQALSDTDALIGSLEQLIAKKRHIKQGVMQELLHPKEDWIDYSFSEICWFQEGPGVRNYQFTTSGVKLFNGTNIEKGKIDLEKTNRYISESKAFGWYSHFMADAGDIVIACSGISVDKFDEKVAILEAWHLPLCMNTSTMRFKVMPDKIDKFYLQHFLRSSTFKEQIGGKATGSAQLNFGPSHVSAVKLKLPDVAEQKAIATILSDMDTAIAALEEKLTKTRQLKQGMMHELLTGRIRLVD
jgi:type I restriction enzyme, S subunit